MAEDSSAGDTDKKIARKETLPDAEAKAMAMAAMLRRQQEASSSQQQASNPRSSTNPQAHQTLQQPASDPRKQQPQRRPPQPIATASAKPVRPTDAHSCFQRALQNQQSRELAATTIRANPMPVKKPFTASATKRPSVAAATNPTAAKKPKPVDATPRTAGFTAMPGRSGQGGAAGSSAPPQDDGVVKVRRYVVQNDDGCWVDFSKASYPLWVHGLWSDDNQTGRRQVLRHYVGRDGADKPARFFDLKNTDRRVQALSFDSNYSKKFPHLIPHDNLKTDMVSIAASSISKPRSQPHTGAPTSLQAPPSWGPVPPQHARATAAVEQGVAGGRAEDVPTVRYDEKDGVMAIQDVYGVMYAIADRKKASNKMRYNWNEGRDKEMHACLVEKFYEKNQRYDFTKHTRTSASFAPMVVSSRSELLLVCDVTLRMAPQSNGGSEEQQQQLRARTLQLLKCFNTNYPRMWPNEEDPFPEYVRKAEQYSVSIGWGVVGLGGGGSGSGKAAAGGSGQKRSETDDDHQMAQAMQREINSLRATPRVKPASTSNGVLGAPLGSSGLTSAAAFAAVVQHPSSSAARYEESDSDDETLAARRDRSNGGGRVVQQEQRLSLSQEPQPPSFVINQAWEGSPVSGSDDDEEYSQSRKEIEEQLESQMQDEALDDAELLTKPNESICCACDDGGDLLMCDSVCMRSFHRSCTGLHKAEWLNIKKSTQAWVCPNCMLQIHQCFVCKEYGDAKEARAGDPPRTMSQPGAAPLVLKPVHKCGLFECGRFYHQHCMPAASTDAFICDSHRCNKCGELHTTMETDITKIDFVNCRRCVVGYHARCLPPELCDYDEGTNCTRLWTPHHNPGCHFKYTGRLKKDLESIENDQVDTPFIYCPKHPLVDDRGNCLDSPAFVKPLFSKALIRMWRDKLSEEPDQALGQMQFAAPSSLPPLPAPAVLPEPTTPPRPAAANAAAAASAVEAAPTATCSDALASQRAFAVTPSPARDRQIAQYTQEERAPFNEEQTWHRLANLRKRANKLMPTLQQLINKLEGGAYGKGTCQVPTMERIHAICTSAEKAAKNPSFWTDALLKNFKIINTQMRVYLGPYIFMKGYTSFGRHFTATEKLEVVTDSLMCLLHPGDCVVDFSSGSNEFVAMLKRKCNASGGALANTCSFVGFDIVPGKFHEDFVKSNWFKVHMTDLPVRWTMATSEALARKSRALQALNTYRLSRGHAPLSQPSSWAYSHSNVVLGLNPPFGVASKLAVKFIRHRLDTQPRLIVLIVPMTTPLPLAFTQPVKNAPPGLQPPGAPPYCGNWNEQGSFEHHYSPHLCQYEVLHWDTSVMKGQAFYFPGSQEHEGSSKEAPDSNKKPPAFIILRHVDAVNPMHWWDEMHEA